jgi:hypothetical protein
VAKNGDEKSIWTELGAAWPHKDGKGFQLKFKASPFGECDVVLRAIVPKANAEAPKSRGKSANRQQSVAASAEAGAQ